MIRLTLGGTGEFVTQLQSRTLEEDTEEQGSLKKARSQRKDHNVAICGSTLEKVDKTMDRQTYHGRSYVKVKPVSTSSQLLPVEGVSHLLPHLLPHRGC